jgi:hypothetical protein
VADVAKLYPNGSISLVFNVDYQIRRLDILRPFRRSRRTKTIGDRSLEAYELTSQGLNLDGFLIGHGRPRSSGQKWLELALGPRGFNRKRIEMGDALGMLFGFNSTFGACYFVFARGFARSDI